MEEAKTPRTELTELVHHVELNKAGWRDKALKRLILSALWLHGNDLTAEGISQAIQSEFAVSVDAGRARTLCKEMCDDGTLVVRGTGSYVITQAEISRYEEEIDAAEREDELAKDLFVGAVRNCCPELSGEEMWDKFVSELLQPLVRELGARMYELMSGTVLNVVSSSTLATFLRAYPGSVQPAIRNTIIEFLNPNDKVVRSYVLRHLNAYLLVQATNLSDQAIDSLFATTRKRPSFKVFLDTNFLFSALGIHENPANEAAQSLLDLLAHVHKSVEVKLYVLQTTVREAKRVIGYNVDLLRGLALPRNLASAAARVGLSGLAMRYAQECARAASVLSAEDFFGPYIHDLMSILHSKGIKVYNDHVDAYATSQNVIDDILAQQEHEKDHPRPKTYEELEHDMTLWHVARDRRPSVLESPLGAQYWVVTIDHRFLGFDRYKQSSDPIAIPVCLHPTALIQMLQLWVPRTEESEKAILGTIRLPFLFHTFDREAEQVTITILRALSRFEGCGDLTVETAQRLLVSSTLRDRMKGELTAEEQTEAVREALIDVDRQRSERAREAQLHAQKWQKEVEDHRATTTDLKTKLQIAQAEAEQAAQARDQERRDRNSLEERLSEMEMAATSIRRFVRLSVQRFLLLAALGASISVALLHFKAPFSVSGILVTSGLSICVWLYLLDRTGQENQILKKRVWFRRLHRFRRGVFVTVLIPGIVNLVTNYLSGVWAGGK